jgi:hypothetical protein
VSRLTHAWSAMRPEQRLAAVASLALLVTMFFPWYGLQSLNVKTKAIYSHNISAFGDVSFVEAAIFLVALGVAAMLLARAEGREFHMPGGDGTVVLIAGSWAGLLIFFRVFSRPAGDGYPVGIEWGFFLAFVAAGCLAFAGLRMRANERPEPPRLRSRREARTRAPIDLPPETDPDTRVLADARASPRRPTPASSAPAPSTAPTSSPTPAGRRPIAARKPSSPRPAYPPGPTDTPEQLSFEDTPPTRTE